jgi:hypothetical protein
VAVLVAPLALAVAAERFGLVEAWPLVGAVAVVAIGVLVATRPVVDGGT